MDRSSLTGKQILEALGRPSTPAMPDNFSTRLALNALIRPSNNVSITNPGSTEALDARGEKSQYTMDRALDSDPYALMRAIQAMGMVGRGVPTALKDEALMHKFRDRASNEMDRNLMGDWGLGQAKTLPLPNFWTGQEWSGPDASKPWIDWHSPR